MPDDPLSYERDIAPLQQRFFQGVMGSAGIRPELAAKMSLQFSSAANGVLEQAQKLTDFEDVRRNRQLQYESALFSLDREREKAARERSMLTSLAPFQAELDNILNGDEEEDYYSKQRKLGSLGVQYAPLFAVNPAAETAYRAAQTGIVRPPKPDLTAAAYVREGGHYGFLQDYGKSLGRPIRPDEPIPFDVFNRGVELSKAEAWRQKETERQREKDEAAQEANTKELVGFVSKAKTAEDKLTGKVDPTKFEGAMDAAAVDGLIASFGTPEERKQAADANAAARLAISQRIAAEYLTGLRQRNAPKDDSIGKLFGTE